MRFTGLIVASVLLFSATLVAQHSATSSGSSSPSNNASASSSGNSYASSASASAAHSTSGSSSASSAAHGSNSSANSSPGKSATNSSHGPARTGAIAKPEPAKTGGSATNSVQAPKPEHHGFFSSLHHRKPATEMDDASLRHGHCPAGQSPGKNGACVPNTNTLLSDTVCPPNKISNGTSCQESPNNCAQYRGRGSSLAVEVANLKAQMQQACSANPSGPECRSLTERRDQLLAQYRGLLAEYPVACRNVLLSDPATL